MAQDFSETIANNPIFIEYGDGTDCKAYDVKYNPKTDRYMFWLMPDERILKYFDKAAHDYGRADQGVIIRTYPAKWVIQWDLSAQFSRWLILCDFEGMETKLTEIWKEKDKRIDQLWDEKETLAKKVAALNMKIRKMEEQEDEFHMKKIASLKGYKELFGGSVADPNSNIEMFNGGR